MKRYVGIMYDDREPEHILHRFISIDRDDVKDKIDGVYRDFTDPDDGVRPSHLTDEIKEEQAVSLLLNQEELQLVIDCLGGTHYCNGPKCALSNMLKAECNRKLTREFEASDSSDIVTIYCYGSAKQMERSKAIEEFTTAISCSEGSEQGRYCRILADLRGGKKIASDGDPIPVM